MPSDDLNYIVGLDLGAMRDFSALSFVEMRQGSKAADKPAFDVTYLHRWPLGTPYPKIVEGVGKMLAEPPFSRKVYGGRGYRDDHLELCAPVTLAVDATGVGRPVVDMFAEAELPGHLMPVTITGGHAVSQAAGGYNVPKRILVSGLQVALQTKRLRIAAKLPEAATLKNELQNFQLTFTEAANDTYEGRKGAHDDLVLAVALALWAGTRASAGRVTDEERAIFAELANYRGR